MNKLEMLKQESDKHPYYCSESNYYSNDAAIRFDTMRDFLNSFGDADVDMNLCFRWDVHNHDDGEHGYWAEVFIMLQRKGKFVPCYISSFEEKDADDFVAYLGMHKNTLMQLWNGVN